MEPISSLRTNIQRVVVHLRKLVGAFAIVPLGLTASCERAMDSVRNEEIRHSESAPNVSSLRNSVQPEDAPIDGEIHISKIGNFKITKETQFCVEEVHEGGFMKFSSLGGIYLYEFIKATGQDAKLNGVGRVKFAPCSLTGDVVRITRRVGMNTAGRPYRLTWSAHHGATRLLLTLQREASDPKNWPVKRDQFTQLGDSVTYDGSVISQRGAEIIFQLKVNCPACPGGN